MGDPRKLKNKTERPKKLWEIDRIKHDKELKLQYGLKNTRELWTATAELKRYRRESRRILALPAEEAEADSNKVLSKLFHYGILKQGSSIDDVLSLTQKDILERRLQTIVLRKGLAKTMKQSRQLITHGYIAIGDRRVSIPGYLVTFEEEKTIRHAKPIELSAKEIPDEAPKKAEASAEKPVPDAGAA